MKAVADPVLKAALKADPVVPAPKATRLPAALVRRPPTRIDPPRP